MTRSTKTRPKVHQLKTWPQYFEPVNRGDKTFEIRFNDRNFTTGEYLSLQEFDPTEQSYTGRSALFRITFITDFEQKPGFVVMGIKPFIEPIEDKEHHENQ